MDDKTISSSFFLLVALGFLAQYGFLTMWQEQIRLPENLQEAYRPRGIYYLYQACGLIGCLIFMTVGWLSEHYSWVLLVGVGAGVFSWQLYEIYRLRNKLPCNPSG